MKFYPEGRFSRTRCNSCGTCADICPSMAIKMNGGYPLFNRSQCIGCGHCGVYCPGNAFGMEPLPGKAATPQQFMELLERRRSIRFYSSKVPSDDEISILTSVLSQSPTGVNLQGIIVRVVSGTQAVERLLEPVRKTLGILAYTGLLRILGKITGKSEYLGRLRAGEDVIFRGAPVVLFFHAPRRNPTGSTDGVIAATAVMYHAVSMGMGTLWNGIAEKLYPIIRSWHTPATRGTRLAAVLCVGYPDLEPQWKAPARDFSILE